MEDEGFLRALIDLFLNDMPRQIELLRQAVEAQDRHAVRRSAHRLRGAGAHLGAEPFSDLCHTLEQLGRQGNLEQAPALLRDMEIEFSRLQDFLTRLPDKGSAR